MPKGRPHLLCHEDEETIIRALRYTTKFGWPCSQEDLQKMVRDYCQALDRSFRWGSDGPSQFFLRSFEQRWQNFLSRRPVQLMSGAAAEELHKTNLEEFFCKMRDLYSKHDIHKHPECLFNLDETHLNASDLAVNSFSGMDQYSVLVCGNAAGEIISPFILCKSQHLNDAQCIDTIPGYQFVCSNSEWMDSDILDKWMDKIFIPHKRKTLGNRKAIVFLDGHNSHLSLKVATMAKENNIILMCLPGNIAATMRPFEIGFFGFLKRTWKDILCKWYEESHLQISDKIVFSKLLSSLWKQFNRRNLRRNFESVGLYPLDILKAEKRIIRSKNKITASTSPCNKLKRTFVYVVSSDRTHQTNDANQKQQRIQTDDEEIPITDSVIKKVKNMNHLQDLKNVMECGNIEEFQYTMIPDGFFLHNVPANGNCLFASICMAVHGTLDTKRVREVRLQAVHQIVQNFHFFEETILTTHQVSCKNSYKQKMQQDGIFGDHHELLSLCLFYNMCATVFCGPECNKQIDINEPAKGNFTIYLLFNQNHYDLLSRPPCVGDWVVVTYDGISYPGNILEMEHSGDCRVSVLHKATKHWIHPTPPDIIWYSSSNIGRRIIPPVPKGRRGQMYFQNVEPL